MSLAPVAVSERIVVREGTDELVVEGLDAWILHIVAGLVPPVQADSCPRSGKIEGKDDKCMHMVENSTENPGVTARRFSPTY